MSLLLAALRRATDARLRREAGARRKGRQATVRAADESVIPATIGTRHEHQAPLPLAGASASPGAVHSDPGLVTRGVLDGSALYARERIRRVLLTIGALIVTAVVLGAGGFAFHSHRDALLRARLEAARAPVAPASVAPVSASSTSEPDRETPPAPVGAAEPYRTLTAAGAAPRADVQAAAIGVAQTQTDRERRVARPVEAITITRTATHAKIAAALGAGYRAFQDGATDAAFDHYRRALTLDGDNRDALLGLAAIAVRRGEHGEAATLYRNLLRENPRAPELHFALGSLHGGARRWRDALAAFREAHRYDRGSPDVLFNLAVSLDHLNETAAAMRYYAAALHAAADRAGTFDLEAARARLRGLRESRAGAG